MTFAPDHDVPIPYMQRTRDYYLALGFGNPYRWAHFADVPFTPLATPLAQARVALITTAAPYQPDAGDQGPGARYNAAAKFYKVYSDSTETVPDLRISHVGYDRVHTTAKDPSTWFPLARLQEAVKAGRIGALTPLAAQLAQARAKWREAGVDPILGVASPYDGAGEIESAAREVAEQGADVIFMDCMGYSLEMKARARAAAGGRPVVLARSAIARVLAEIVE